jgi:hypothetical protein
MRLAGGALGTSGGTSVSTGAGAAAGMATSIAMGTAGDGGTAGQGAGGAATASSPDHAGCGCSVLGMRPPAGHWRDALGILAAALLCFRGRKRRQRVSPGAM